MILLYTLAGQIKGNVQHKGRWGPERVQGHTVGVLLKASIFGVFASKSAVWKRLYCFDEVYGTKSARTASISAKANSGPAMLVRADCVKPGKQTYDTKGEKKHVLLEWAGPSGNDSKATMIGSQTVCISAKRAEK